MTVVVTPPFQFFADRKGDGLDAGFVYVGLPNQDPQTNPVAVFWDAAQTIAAPNPARTFAGWLSNNGSPGSLFTDDDYSILVTDKRGIVVWSSPTTARTGLGDIVLTSGEKLQLQDGSFAEFLDGSSIFIGDGTGTAVGVAVDPSARWYGAIIPAVDSSFDVGSPTRRVDLFADNIDARTATVITGITPLVAGAASSGTNAKPWGTSVSRAISVDDLRVYRTAQPANLADYSGLAQLSARDRLLACCHQTSATSTAVLGGDPFNVVSINRTALGVYDVTFLVPLSPLSYVMVTPISVLGAGAVAVSWTSSTVLKINLTAGGAADLAFDLFVRGAASSTGVAGLPASPIL